MIIHRFICDGCEIIVTDSNTKTIHKCPECNGGMRWILNFAIHGNYKHPIHSDAMAISPDQRAEHEKLFPNIKLDPQCRPIFENFVDHEAYMKKCGIVKTPKKIKCKREIISKILH